jgi:DNA-binding XRE family transcriptional regulator
MTQGLDNAQAIAHNGHMIKHAQPSRRGRRAHLAPKAVPYNDVIRLARLAARLTQQELADRVGVSEGMISRLESAQRQYPSYTTMVRIARALNLPAEELFPVPDYLPNNGDAA